MTPDFTQSDAILGHLDGLVAAVADDFIKSRYTGFVAVCAVTTFETNIRAKIVGFCRKKHRVFGDFSEALFEQTNARIKMDHLRKEYLGRFGAKYLKRFNTRLDRIERDSLSAGNGSVKGSYSNLVQWRHDFVHEGMLPNYAGYQEARDAYENGKKVITVFFESLNN